MCNLQVSLNINHSENNGDGEEMSPFFNYEEHTEKKKKHYKSLEKGVFSSLLDGEGFFLLFLFTKLTMI